MSPKVLLTFAFQLMMGRSSLPLPPFPSFLPPTAWKTCEATPTNRQKNRNQLANCTRRCPSPLTLTLTQALVETPTVQSVFCPAPAVATPLSLSSSLWRNCCVAPVWCFEPRVATHSVCECERAVDRSTTIEVIVSEILGFFSKLSESRGRV